MMQDNFTITDANREARDKIMSFSPRFQSLFIYGGCGTGKTTLAKALYAKCRDEVAQRRGYMNEAKEFVEVYREESAKMIAWPELRREIRASIKDPEAEDMAIKDYARLKLLVIDDLGAGNESEYSSQILWEILDKRIASKTHGLIITSNFSLAQLAERMNNDRAPSRIAYLCEVVKLDGEDFRLKKRA